MIFHRKAKEAEDYVSQNERDRRPAHARPRAYSLPSMHGVRVQMPVARNTLSPILDKAGLFRQLEQTKIMKQIPRQALKNVLDQIRDDELNIVRLRQLRSFLEVYQDYWEDFENGENLELVRKVILQERSQSQTGDIQESVQVPQPLSKSKQSPNPPNPELEMQTGADLDVTARQDSLKSEDFKFSMERPRTIRGLIVTHSDKRRNLDAVGTLPIHTEKRKNEIRHSKTFAEFLRLVKNILLEQSRAVSGILALGSKERFAFCWQYSSFAGSYSYMVCNSQGSFQGLCTFPGMGGGKGGAEYMIDFSNVEFKILKRNKDVDYYVGDAKGLPVVIQILSNGEIDLMSSIPPGMQEGYGNMVLKDKRRVISEEGEDKRIEEESLKQMYEWKENNSYIAQAQEEFRAFLEVYYNYMQEKGFHTYAENVDILSRFIDAVIQEAERRKLDRNAMEEILRMIIGSAQE